MTEVPPEDSSSQEKPKAEAEPDKPSGAAPEAGPEASAPGRVGASESSDVPRPDAGTKAEPPAMKIEKGSARSMWELLMQLRILLPYLTRLVPLLDKGLLHAPDLTELRGDVKQTQLASRDATDRIDRIDARIQAQSVELREAADASQKQVARLASSLRSLRRLMAGILILLLLALAILIALLVLRLR